MEKAVWPETFDKVARPRGRFQNSAVLQSRRDDNQNLSVFNGADSKVVFSPSQAKCVRL